MSESHVEQAVTARIAAARQRTEDMRRQRAELAAARRAGKARAHAAKLARQASAGQTDGTAGFNVTPANASPVGGPANDRLPAGKSAASTSVAQQTTTGEGQA